MSDIFTLENFAKCIDIVTSPLLNCTPEIRNKRWGIAHMILYFMYCDTMFDCLDFVEYHHAKAKIYFPNTMQILSSNKLKSYINYMIDNPNLEREEYAFIYYSMGYICQFQLNNYKLSKEYYKISIHYGNNMGHYYIECLYQNDPNCDMNILFNMIIKNKDMDIKFAKYRYFALLSFIKKNNFNMICTQEYIDNHIYNYICKSNNKYMPGYYLFCKLICENKYIYMYNRKKLKDIENISINYYIEICDFLYFNDMFTPAYNIALKIVKVYDYYYYKAAYIAYKLKKYDAAKVFALAAINMHNSIIIKNDMYLILYNIHKADPEICFDYYIKINIKYISCTNDIYSDIKYISKKGFLNMYRVKWTKDRHKHFNLNNNIVITILLCSKHKNNSRYIIPPKFIMLQIYSYTI